jgi:hypothetical protein
MSRAPRSKSTAIKSRLLEALEFCSCVSEKVGVPYETHIGLRNNWAIAFNGIVAAGSPISEDIVAYPHTLMLVEALSKCDENFTITQLDNGRLSIKSGKFKVIVPCLDPQLMQNAFPDPVVVGLDNRFKAAVEAVGVLASENAQHVLTASVLMHGASVISTNRVMIMEYWHGLDLPPGVPLPKQFVAALVKQKKNLTGFGFSSNSATFHFEDGCWIKTQLYSDEWPDVSKILNREANLWAIDGGFYKALDAVAPFSEDGNVYSDLNLLMSHQDSALGATHECAGIPKGFVYPIKQLQIIKPHVEKIDWMASGIHDSSYCLVFQGGSMRGVISGRQKQ